MIINIFEQEYKINDELIAKNFKNSIYELIKIHTTSKFDPSTNTLFLKKKFTLKLKNNKSMHDKSIFHKERIEDLLK